LKSSLEMESNKGLSLILGVNGQDGSYLAESLIARGRSVVGVGRQETSRYVPNSKNFVYRQLDLANIKGFVELLNELLPNKIFHVAAIHGSHGFNYEEKWLEAHSVNTLTVHATLEYLRCIDGDGSLIYLSSSKAFSLPLPALVSETAERKSSCIYSITKNTATDLIHYYRDAHGISASVLWTFNHESERRGEEYFIPRIVNCLASAIENSEHSEEIFTLNFHTDWSDVAELMDISIIASDICSHEDFIFASGETTFSRDLVKSLFAKFGLDYRNHIIEKNPEEVTVVEWQADISKMSRMLGCQPRTSIYTICLKILESKYGYGPTHKLFVND
jgi:GDPmannose 4,6-dehydratase